MLIKNSFVTKGQNMKQKSKRNRNSLVIATWNIRTLVECSVDERICRKQLMGVVKHGFHGDKPGKIDRKIDLLMGELRKYGVSVAWIQETKWFGKDVWPVGRYIFLLSGCPLPGDQERVCRNEGIGIALHEKATVAWKNAGEVWEAVSSRIILAILKWVRTGKKKRGWSGKASGTYVSVVCAYTPTVRKHSQALSSSFMMICRIQ